MTAVHRALRAVAALVVAAVTLVLLPAPADATYSVALPSGRRYTIHVEQTGSTGATAPTVIVLHGLSNSSTTVANQAGFDHVGTTRGWNVVYGETPTGGWNAGLCCSRAVTNNQADVQYLLDVVANLHRRGHYGPVHLVGFSNGGMLALRAGCEHPAVFSRVASVSGPLVAPCPGGIPHARHIHGVADSVVPIEGGYSSYCLVTFPSTRTEYQRLVSADYRMVAVEDTAHRWPDMATPYIREFFAAGVQTRSTVSVMENGSATATGVNGVTTPTAAATARATGRAPSQGSVERGAPTPLVLAVPPFVPPIPMPAASN